MAVTSTKVASVNTVIKNLPLSDSKKAQASKLGEELYQVINSCPRKVDKKAYQVRLESLLVEWGVPPSVASKAPDYQGIARLVAAAAVAAE